MKTARRKSQKKLPKNGEKRPPWSTRFTLVSYLCTLAFAGFLLWMVLAVDCVLSWSLLRRYRDTELLTVGAVLAQTRAVSQSSTSL